MEISSVPAFVATFRKSSNERDYAPESINDAIETFSHLATRLQEEGFLLWGRESFGTATLLLDFPFLGQGEQRRLRVRVTLGTPMFSAYVPGGTHIICEMGVPLYLDTTDVETAIFFCKRCLGMADPESLQPPE